MLKKYIIIISLMLMTCVQAAEWREVAKGLEIKEFKIELYSPAGDSIITILRIDPELWDFSLLTASQTGNGSLTAKQWCAKNKLAAAFNAGMFLTDYSTNVGYMN
ncbi:MAG: hypothetical protein H8E87_07600, partial [FCB group bacterium]|nr:hypothetical protein [FCB group bacterium]